MSLILVTGAKGAIGHHVVARAKRLGDNVIGLGHGDWSSDPELPEIDGWMNASVSGDSLSLLAKTHGLPDVIIHLAGGSAVGPSVLNPAEDFRRTVISAHNVLEWVRTQAPACKLVIASSAAVYGNGHVVAIPEDAPANPWSPYGAHKAMIEVLASTYGRQFGLSVAIIRLFSVFGPGLRKQLVWDICRRGLSGESAMILGGNGTEARDFLTVEDAADILLRAAALATDAVPVFNGCSGRPTTTRALAEALAALLPIESVQFSGMSRPGDPVNLVGNPARSARHALAASESLESGLARTVAWARLHIRPPRV